MYPAGVLFNLKERKERDKILHLSTQNTVVLFNNTDDLLCMLRDKAFYTQNADEIDSLLFVFDLTSKAVRNYLLLYKRFATIVQLLHHGFDKLYELNFWRVQEICRSTLDCLCRDGIVPTIEEFETYFRELILPSPDILHSYYYATICFNMFKNKSCLELCTFIQNHDRGNSNRCILEKLVPRIVKYYVANSRHLDAIQFTFTFLVDNYCHNQKMIVYIMSYVSRSMQIDVYNELSTVYLHQMIQYHLPIYQKLHRKVHIKMFPIIKCELDKYLIPDLQDIVLKYLFAVVIGKKKTSSGSSLYQQIERSLMIS